MWMLGLKGLKRFLELYLLVKMTVPICLLEKPCLAAQNVVQETWILKLTKIWLDWM